MRKRFALSSEFSEDLLRQALPSRFALGGLRRESQRRIWIDTFDWRLAAAGLRAFYAREQQGCFRLTVFDEDGYKAEVDLTSAPRMPSQLPDEPGLRVLRAAAGIRRLLPRVEVRARRSVARVLDDERKTIGWLVLETRRAATPDGRENHDLEPRAVFRTVRGFDREIGSLCSHLESTGLMARDDREELQVALAAIGRTTGDYSSKLRFDLEPAMPATEALALSFSLLAGIMRVNEPGLVARLDVEFLHDYRVAVRRTRSLLSHFGDVLTTRRRDWARRFFSDLGRRTGAARDLDVLLLELPSYAGRLPVERREGLAALRQRFEHDVDREYAAFSRWLGSKTYRRGLDRWLRTLEVLGAHPSEETIAELAAQAIAQTASKVFKQAKKIARSDDDEPVHRLRIRCKKLRYVLEFSRSLTPGGEVGELISALKRLQDVLGTFQDLVVHGPRLEATAEREPADPDLALATGWLLAELEQRHREVRKTVDDTVERFRREGPPRLERVLEHLAPAPVAAS